MKSAALRASYRSVGNTYDWFMARSSRETGHSGSLGSQLPDGMCFGRVWFMQSCPSVFFSPAQLAGKVYPSLLTAAVSCLRRKVRVVDAFPVTFASLWICKGLRSNPALRCSCVLKLSTDSPLLAWPERASLCVPTVR